MLQCIDRPPALTLLFFFSFPNAPIQVKIDRLNALCKLACSRLFVLYEVREVNVTKKTSWLLPYGTLMEGLQELDALHPIYDAVSYFCKLAATNKKWYEKQKPSYAAYNTK